MRRENKVRSNTPLITMLVAAGVLGIVLETSDAHALPGTHGPSVSIWDTTLSTVVFAFHNGFLVGGGHLRFAGYNSNFSSTTGKLSAQFGMHYVGYQGSEEEDKSSHGISGTAVALYGIPIADRYDNGLPKAAFTFFLGGAPTALFNGSYNYVTIPIPLGLAMPFSPIRHMTISPWIEIAPSVNIDTEFKGVNDVLNEDDLEVDPETGDVDLDQMQAENVVSEATDMKVSFAARFRGGLSFAFHLGDKVDLAVNAIVSHAGPEFTGPVAVFVGGAVSIAWDDPPPAVLPAEKRLEREDCSVVKERYSHCESYKHLMERLEKAEAVKEKSAALETKLPETKPEPTPPPAEEPTTKPTWVDLPPESEDKDTDPTPPSE